MDWFGFIWIAIVAFIAYWNWAWFWRARKTGVATVYFHHEFKRDEKPFEFRMIQLGRIAGLIVAIAMLFLGSRFMIGLSQ